jgi:hypothetical protein
MAPRPEGFNITGYVVPGAAILLAGSILALYLTRRRAVALAEAAPAVAARPAATSTNATAEELELLERELRQDDE